MEGFACRKKTHFRFSSTWRRWHECCNYFFFTGGSDQMRVLVSGADAKDLAEVVEILNSKQIPLV